MKNNYLKTALLTLFISMMIVGCEKETSTDNSGTSNQHNVSLDQLVGTWTASSDAYYKILFHDLDGNLIDSIVTDYDPESTFTFTATQVSTPWMLTYGYDIADNSLVLHYSGLNDRTYSILDFDQRHLVLERIAEGQDYMMGETPVVGTEIEHWDLVR